MKKLLAFMLVLVCVFSLVACSGKPLIVSIRDISKTEAVAVLQAEQCFYSEDDIHYYFSDMRACYIIVTYLNGDSEDIITALESGRATISDLDKFGIDYYTKPKK